MLPATKLLSAIDDAIERDQGSQYRQLLEHLLPKMEDAYRASDSPFRTHLGASLIGRKCSRELWLGFRWANKASFIGRILRLFNRGHLEEARLIALLIIAGCEVWYETENGGQFRLSDFGGHFGSALDGVTRGVPDMPNETMYAEFKTHNKKSFDKLIRKGVKEAKPEHYTQMQQCMHSFNLKFGLYLAVCKDDDELHAEIISYDVANATQYRQRAGQIIFTDKAPSRISRDPSWFDCRYCDRKHVCHGYEMPEINCRTCAYSTPREDGTWHCDLALDTCVLPKEGQLAACSDHTFNPEILYLSDYSILDGGDSIKATWFGKTFTYGCYHDDCPTSEDVVKFFEECKNGTVKA